jgi:hypothetical protein
MDALKVKALEYLLSVWPEEKQVCPICSGTDWGVSDTAVIPRRGGAEITSGPDLTRVYPVVPVNCQTCGYTFFLNEKWVRAGGTPPDVRERLANAKVQAEDGSQ